MLIAKKMIFFVVKVWRDVQ